MNVKSLIGAILLPSTVQAGVLYSLSPLTPLPGDTTSQVVDINNAGVVAGTSVHYLGGPSVDNHAVVWNNSIPTNVEVSTTDIYGTQTTAINDAGDVIGRFVKQQQSGGSPNTEMLAFAKYSGSGFFRLQPPPSNLGTSGSLTNAFDINNAGVVVGNGSAGGGGGATMWKPDGSVTLLNTGGVAYGINNAGVVVGTTSDYKAFRWDNGNLTVFPTDSNSAAEAIDVSDNNIVIGYVGSDAVMWDSNNHMTVIGLLPGTSNSVPQDINTHGVVVGNSGDFSTGQNYQPWIWDGTSLQNLNDLLLPQDRGLMYVSGINDAGQIVGQHSVYGSVVLTLVPEPTSVGIMSFGFMILTRRKR